MGRSDEVHLTGIYKGLTRTEQSIKVEIDGDSYVLPVSETDYTEDPEIGEEIDIIIPQWLADDRGLA